MKFTKRITSIALVVIMVITLLPTIVLADSIPSSWAVEQIEEAKALGLVTNELLNDFSATTTRIEFCRAAVKLLRKYGYSVDSVNPKMFSDTNDRDIGIAAALGITNGTDAEKNLFSPHDPLTREQAATLLNNVLGVIGKRMASASVTWTDVKNISSWATQSASDMYNCGVIGGTDTTKLVFSPKMPYTHEQSIVTLLRMWKYIDPKDTYNPDDYDSANLRQSQNEVVLADDVKNVSAPKGTNKLIYADETQKQYTFDNIDDSIKNLTVGDKFVIYPCDSVPDGLAVIVAAIEISGNRATVTSSEISLKDIVKSMDVAQIIPMTSYMITDYGYGVTPILPQTSSSRASNAIGNRLYNSYASSETVSGSKSKTLTPYKIDIPLGDNMKISGEIKLSATLKADIDLHEGWFNIPTGIDYFELSLDNQMQIDLKFEGAYENQIVDMARVYRVQDGTLKQKYANYTMTKEKADKYSQKLFTSEFPIPTAPGLAATVTWYLTVTFDGQFSIEAVYTQNNSLGIKLQNGQWSPINTNYSNLTVCGAADATLYAGTGIEVGLSFIKVVAAYVEPEVGIEIKASTEFNEILFDTDGNTTDRTHDCYLCVDGDINLKLSLNAKVDAFGFGNVLDRPLIEPHRIKLWDFYLTFGGRSHGAELGWSICPYQNGHRYKVYDVSMTWFEAKAYCESLGGHLATITSQEEQGFIVEMIQTHGLRSGYYTGATEDNVEGNWVWITDELWNYSNWSSGEPNDLGTEYIAEIYRNGYWNDLDHFEYASRVGFICEWDNIDTSPLPSTDKSTETPVADKSATSFIDVKNPDDVKILDLLTDIKVVERTDKDKDGNFIFNPNDFITRQEMAMLLAKMRTANPEFFTSSHDSTASNLPFKDVTDPKYFAAISYCCNSGIMSGKSAETFDPSGGVNLDEALAMMISSLGYTGLSYPIGTSMKAKELGFALEYKEADFSAPITRIEVARLLYTYFHSEYCLLEVVRNEATGAYEPVQVFAPVKEKFGY